MSRSPRPAAGPRRGGHSAVFAPLEVGRRADAVMQRISDGIRLGLLPGGHQLPAEAELAEGFGVSAVTVREALTALREKGLVETRRGRGGGSFVRSVRFDEDDLLVERLRAMGPFELRDLADHLVAVVGTTALLAADRAGRADLDQLRATVEELAGPEDNGFRRRAQARFHVELAAAAQSARLTRAVIDLQAEAGPVFWTTSGTQTGRGDDDLRYRAVVDAVAAGDGHAARAEAVAHIYSALARASAFQLTLLGEEPR